jgi:hypothetical protein
MSHLEEIGPFLFSPSHPIFPCDAARQAGPGESAVEPAHSKAASRQEANAP